MKVIVHILPETNMENSSVFTFFFDWEQQNIWMFAQVKNLFSILHYLVSIFIKIVPKNFNDNFSFILGVPETCRGGRAIWSGSKGTLGEQFGNALLRGLNEINLVAHFY